MLRALIPMLALAGCVAAAPAAGPVVRRVPDAPLMRLQGDAAGNMDMVEYARGPALSVSGAPGSSAARQAIFAHCGGVGVLDPNLDTDGMWTDPETGDYRMAGDCAG